MRRAGGADVLYIVNYSAIVAVVASLGSVGFPGVFGLLGEVFRMARRGRGCVLPEVVTRIADRFSWPDTRFLDPLP